MLICSFEHISKWVNAIKDIIFLVQGGYKTMIRAQIKIGTIHVIWTYFSIFLSQTSVTAHDWILTKIYQIFFSYSTDIHIVYHFY
jgi:hypothetical protein